MATYGSTIAAKNFFYADGRISNHAGLFSDEIRWIAKSNPEAEVTVERFYSGSGPDVKCSWHLSLDPDVAKAAGISGGFEVKGVYRIVR